MHIASLVAAQPQPGLTTWQFIAMCVVAVALACGLMLTLWWSNIDAESRPPSNHGADPEEYDRTPHFPMGASHHDVQDRPHTP
ncbi:MAG TPA: hypothetical protein VK176_12230 [Phycisphaerales bacterium]|nr:hypothetical protein [Phycisphaerales bacterium]